MTEKTDRALLAIDPGNSTGIAFRRADGTVHFRTWRLEGTGGGRIVEFDALLNALHSVEKFGRLSYEQPFFSTRFPTAAEPLLDLTGHIKFWCARRQRAHRRLPRRHHRVRARLRQRHRPGTGQRRTGAARRQPVVE